MVFVLEQKTSFPAEGYMHYVGDLTLVKEFNNFLFEDPLAKHALVQCELSFLWDWAIRLSSSPSLSYYLSLCQRSRIVI